MLIRIKLSKKRLNTTADIMNYILTNIDIY